ncbi:unnamed protein product [Caenorhabditis sp. 36 PRJEB53466]|nr:unnamed protein product [Caenorhabditis sp. 36 PRJEB53466]
MKSSRGTRCGAKLSVTTVGYYARDRHFQVTCGRKPTLLISDLSSLRFPIPIPEEEHEDLGSGEDNMESLLNYVKLHPELLDDVEFVTFRQVPAYVAEFESRLEVQAFRHAGRIWIRWNPWPKIKEHVAQRSTMRMGEAGAFSRALEASGDEEKKKKKESSYVKGVFKASMTLPEDPEPTNLLLSGELDGRNAEECHVEVKVTLLPLDKWFAIRSCRCYWQCRLGQVPQIILGHIDQNRMEFDAYRTWTLEQFVEEYRRRCGWNVRKPWTVENGERRIQRMLKSLREHLNEDGASVVLYRGDKFSRVQPFFTGARHSADGEWSVLEGQQVADEFKQLVRGVFTSDEK